MVSTEVDYEEMAMRLLLEGGYESIHKCCDEYVVVYGGSCEYQLVINKSIALFKWGYREEYLTECKKELYDLVKNIDLSN